MHKAMVILSGGQDSTTALYQAQRDYDEVHAVTFNYGQRHALEIEAAQNICRLAGVRHHSIVHVPGILHGRSPLVSEAPLEKYGSFREMDEIIGNRVELTFVPMRNALFLTLAANRAICADIRTVITGICQADNANYPDCREVFRDAMESAINEALGISDFVISAPLLHNSKAQTVEMAYALQGCPLALAFSHTSYDGQYPPTDNNHANVLRAQGFLEANMPDPLVLRAALVDEVMELPPTENYFGVERDPAYAELLHGIRDAVERLPVAPF